MSSRITPGTVYSALASSGEQAAPSSPKLTQLSGVRRDPRTSGVGQQPFAGDVHPQTTANTASPLLRPNFPASVQPLTTTKLL